MQETDKQELKLPPRPEITLCEAVTAFAYGKAMDAVQYMADDETETTEERSAKVKDLIERLHEAAYAGRIRFRALKSEGDHADGHKHIDRLYFSDPRGLRWEIDEIWARDLSAARPKFESQGSFMREWRDVHLDREEFEALLRNHRSSDTDVPGAQNIFRTGLAGRPSSINLVLPVAQSRLTAGDYPDTQAKFSEQLAEHLKKTMPNAPRMTPKAIRNNPEFKELWRRRQPKIIDCP
jgi:hypothetical protein